MSVVLVEMPAAPPLTTAAVANYDLLKSAISTKVTALIAESPSAAVDIDYAMRSLNAHNFGDGIVLPPGTAIHSW